MDFVIDILQKHDYSHFITPCGTAIAYANLESLLRYFIDHNNFSIFEEITTHENFEFSASKIGSLLEVSVLLDRLNFVKLVLTLPNCDP